MAEDGERYAESKGQRFKLMTLPHFRRFRNLALSKDATWTTHYTDDVLSVESKPPGDGSTNLNIIRATRIMNTVPPLVLYNMLHDAQYRVTWDANMLEGYNIAQLDAHNDIGYYAVKSPWPVSNRDFCNQRSWMEFTNGEYIIFNHSEPHCDCPEKKGFVRARSILSGFYIRPQEGGSGTNLVYVTHSDLSGSIPHAIINYVMTKGARIILDKCEKYSLLHPEYVAKTYPADIHFAWRTPKMDWDSAYLYPEEVPQQDTPPAAAQEEEELPAAASSSRAPSKFVEAAAEQPPAHEPAEPFLSSGVADAGPSVQLAAVAPYRVTDALSVQQYRSIMQDAMNAVDRSFLREGRVPTTKEYILRLKYMVEGIRQTTVDV